MTNPVRRDISRQAVTAQRYHTGGRAPDKRGFRREVSGKGEPEIVAVAKAA